MDIGENSAGVRAANVCTDEAADVSSKEQLPLVVYFDQTGAIREVFIEFVVRESGISGEEIARTITATLGKIALYNNNIC